MYFQTSSCIWNTSGFGGLRGLMLTMVFDLEGLLTINPKIKVQK